MCPTLVFGVFLVEKGSSTTKQKTEGTGITITRCKVRHRLCFDLRDQRYICFFFLQITPPLRVKGYLAAVLDIQRSYGPFQVIHHLWTNSVWSYMGPSRVTHSIRSGLFADKIQPECHLSAQCKKSQTKTGRTVLWPASVWTQTSVATYIIVSSFHPGWQLHWHCAITN